VNIAKARNIEEAVELAENLKSSGSHNWFRGQTRNWPVTSSLVRLGQSLEQTVLEKIGRFEYWVKNTPGLEHLASNPDAAIAVAQHYGLPTNFVDFTTEPRIAGFFASNMQDSSDELGCIICVNTEDVKDFWNGMPEEYPPPEFLELNVPDLWRLEAQHGCFMFCPYENFEWIYDFDRILFPNTKPLSGIGLDEIYPRRKSHLEILLDQYFMNERMIESERTMDRSNVNTVFLKAPEGRCDLDVFPQGLPEHPSWSDATLKPWLNFAGESFFVTRTALQFELFVDVEKSLSYIASSTQSQIFHDLMGISGVRNKLIGWQIRLSDNETLPPSFSLYVTERLARLWDGLRRLPHSDEDISTGLATCIAFGVALRGDFGKQDKQHWDIAAKACLNEAIELEFGATDGSYSRGYASPSKLLSAVRSDIESFISPKWRSQVMKSIFPILQTSSDPRRTFDFEILAPIFAREIAPFQVLARSDAIFYSPARLDGLGLP
jgi:hypothetical protein